MGYQETGVGNTVVTYRDVTLKGRMPSGNMSGGSRSQGETPGAGSIFSAVLAERPNLSNRRNLGPSREPSIIGGRAMPVVDMGDRKTGRIGG
jgi:hypothetical protein